jgi:hypothetical protein
MAKYKVYLSVSVPYNTCVEVEAESSEDAETLAVQKFSADETLVLRDSDGNKYDWDEDDVNVCDVDLA